MECGRQHRTNQFPLLQVWTNALPLCLLHVQTFSPIKIPTCVQNLKCVFKMALFKRFCVVWRKIRLPTSWPNNYPLMKNTHRVLLNGFTNNNTRPANVKWLYFYFFRWMYLFLMLQYSFLYSTEGSSVWKNIIHVWWNFHHSNVVCPNGVN